MLVVQIFGHLSHYTMLYADVRTGLLATYDNRLITCSGEPSRKNRCTMGHSWVGAIGRVRSVIQDRTSKASVLLRMQSGD